MTQIKRRTKQTWGYFEFRTEASMGFTDNSMNAFSKVSNLLYPVFKILHIEFIG